MKRLLIFMLLLSLAGGIYAFREPISDLLTIDRSGWVERDGNRYLLDEDGDPRIGWFSGEEGTFYFHQDGVMHTGWLEEGQNRYCFSPEGEMYTGWQTVEGMRRYFDHQGCLGSGLLEQDGKRYYLDENGVPMEGWQQVDGKFCYVTRTGAIPFGWMERDGKKVYLNDEGYCHTGLRSDSTGRYYFTDEGFMVTGWVELENKRYYFAEDGTACTGWLEDDGKRYYILEDGAAAVGKLEIDGETCFFSSTGVNFIMVNPWHALPEGFEPELVYSDGVLLDPECKEALEQMLDGCRAAGYLPMVSSSYRSIQRQAANLNRLIKSYTTQGYSDAEAYSIATQIIAVPGTSEHHLGLAFDIVDVYYTNLDYEQANRPTQKWLMEHCWEYGFILRYPEDSIAITGIIWEPWHYRYVGVEMAMEIHELGNITLEEYIDNLTNDGTTCGGKQPEA